MMRSIGTVLLLLFLSTMLAAGARAENGLQRFERELKPQLQFEKFSYGSAEALGDQGFLLKDVVAVVPATPQTDNKTTTIKVDRVTVEAADFDRLAASNKEDLPRFLKIKLEGVTGDEATSSSLAAYGLPKAPADFALDYKLDTTAKRLTVEKLEISLRGQGRIELSLILDGVSDKADDVEDTKDSGRLQSASITIDDKGLVAQLVEAAAKSQGNKPDDLAALGLLTIASLAGQQDAESMKAFDAMASFLADWHAPKGPITITVKPAKGASFADVGGLMMPNALREVLGLKVTYAGTRAGAATSGPVAK
jgi:hypothetical protein